MKPVNETSKSFKRKLYSIHKKGLEDFIITFSKQKKIKSASDLLPNLMYEYGTSTNGTNYVSCILRKWCGKKGKSDCMLNVEVRESGEETTYVKIFVHKTGTPLWDIKNWNKELR